MRVIVVLTYARGLVPSLPRLEFAQFELQRGRNERAPLPLRHGLAKPRVQVRGQCDRRANSLLRHRYIPSWPGAVMRHRVRLILRRRLRRRQAEVHRRQPRRSDPIPWVGLCRDVAHIRRTYRHPGARRYQRMGEAIGVAIRRPRLGTACVEPASDQGQRHTIRCWIPPTSTGGWGPVACDKAGDILWSRVAAGAT